MEHKGIWFTIDLGSDINGHGQFCVWRCFPSTALASEVADWGKRVREQPKPWSTAQLEGLVDRLGDGTQARWSYTY